MTKIQIQKLTDEQRASRGIPEDPVPAGPWEVWNCEPSKFDWNYDQTEEAYLFSGKVKVTAQGETVELSAGDFVVFPQGLDCSWEVIDAVSKVYRFTN